MEMQMTTLEECVRAYLRDDHLMEMDNQLDKASSLSESPLESMFWHFLRKCDVGRFSKIEGQASAGSYRMDARLTYNDLRIAVELDGNQFHQDTDRDLKRDDYIIRCGHADEIIRIQSLAIFVHDRAFLRPMQEWHQCFECAQEVMTMTDIEWQECLQNAIENGRDADDFISECEPNTSIWNIVDNQAWLTTPKWRRSIGNRTKITRQVARRVRS